MIRVDLFRMWKEKEAREGRNIPVRDVAAAMGIDPDAVSKLKNGKTQRFDAHVLVALCRFIGAKSGEPVPFLIFEDEK